MSSRRGGRGELRGWRSRWNRGCGLRSACLAPSRLSYPSLSQRWAVESCAAQPSKSDLDPHIPLDPILLPIHFRHVVKGLSKLLTVCCHCAGTRASGDGWQEERTWQRIPLARGRSKVPEAGYGFACLRLEQASQEQPVRFCFRNRDCRSVMQAAARGWRLALPEHNLSEIRMQSMVLENIIGEVDAFWTKIMSPSFPPSSFLRVSGL
jgi:hypothetical protein